MNLPHPDDIQKLPRELWLTETRRRDEYRAMRRERRRNSALGRFWRRLRGEDVSATPQRDA